MPGQPSKNQTTRSALLMLLIIIALPLVWLFPKHETRWAPYYVVDRFENSITVNAIGHQAIVPFDTSGWLYSLVHSLERHSGGPAFQDVLVTDLVDYWS